MSNSSLTSALIVTRCQGSPEISCLQAQHTSMSLACSIFRKRLLRAKLSKGAPGRVREPTQCFKTRMRFEFRLLPLTNNRIVFSIPSVDLRDHLVRKSDAGFHCARLMGQMVDIADDLAADVCERQHACQSDIHDERISVLQEHPVLL